jgi:hypothetical protein
MMVSKPARIAAGVAIHFYDGLRTEYGRGTVEVVPECSPDPIHTWTGATTKLINHLYPSANPGTIMNLLRLTNCVVDIERGNGLKLWVTRRDLYHLPTGEEVEMPRTTELMGGGRSKTYREFSHGDPTQRTIHDLNVRMNQVDRNLESLQRQLTTAQEAIEKLTLLYRD